MTGLGNGQRALSLNSRAPRRQPIPATLRAASGPGGPRSFRNLRRSHQMLALVHPNPTCRVEPFMTKARLFNPV